jgi:Short C-terminal domain
MPFASPRGRSEQAAYNRQLQDRFESTRRVEPAAPAAEHDLVKDLNDLGELHRSGVLTDAEFESVKARLLAR